MLPKITLEQFRKLKEKITNFYEETAGDKGTIVLEDQPTLGMFFSINIDKISKRRAKLRSLGITKENYDDWWNNKHRQYLRELISYDLSDIPYQEWEGIRLVSDENQILDFSPTKANIDFSIVQYEGGCSFKGCNIRNLSSLGNKLRADEFDEKIQQENPGIFLTQSLPKEFRESYYQAQLTIAELASLTNNQVEEVIQKINLAVRFQQEERDVIETIGISKALELYKSSSRNYEVVSQIITLAKHKSKQYSIIYDGEDGLASKLKDTPTADMKKVCYDFVKISLLSGSLKKESIDALPSIFREENHGILLIGDNIPETLREKYYQCKLTFSDVIDNIELFSGIPFENFLLDSFSDKNTIKEIIRKVGRDFFAEQIRQHPQFFEYLLETSKVWMFSRELTANNNPEDSFIKAVKKIYTSYLAELRKNENSQTIPEISGPFSTFGFTTVKKINSLAELNSYSSTTIVLDEEQQNLIDCLGIENIKRFEKETAFFSHAFEESDTQMSLFNSLANFLTRMMRYSHDTFYLSFASGTLNYEKFLDNLAAFIEKMRANRCFNSIQYDWLEGTFRDNHPQIFMPTNSPPQLREAFYKNQITLDMLDKNPDYIPFLSDKNLSNIIREKMVLKIENEKGRFEYNLIEFISNRYGNEKLLQLISKYGILLKNIEITCSDEEIKDINYIERKIRQVVYEKITKSNLSRREVDYSRLEGVDEFVMEYPEIFVDFSLLGNIQQEELEKLKNRFYSQKLSFADIKKYPKLKELLKSKNLFVAFGTKYDRYVDGRIKLSYKYSDMELLQAFGNEKFLELCSKYGRYLDNVGDELAEELTFLDNQYLEPNEKRNLSFEEICQRIEQIIYKKCQTGTFKYHQDDAPIFLIQNHPELFLPNETPKELKDAYYNHKMTFVILAKYSDWRKYIDEEKMIKRLVESSPRKRLIAQYFNVFGEENALKLGEKNADTITKIIENNKVDLAKKWYDKTGRKFIPTFVVIETFPESEIDKFLTSGNKWKKLMRIKRYTSQSEAKYDMLKLAYSFGIFDNDPQALRKTMNLLTGLPLKLAVTNEDVLAKISEKIQSNTQQIKFFKITSKTAESENGESYPQMESSIATEEEMEIAYRNMLDYIQHNNCEDEIDTDMLIKLVEAIKTETCIDFRKDIFSQIYKKEKDGTYTLIINQEKCPKTASVVREILEKFEEAPVLTPSKLHRIFGGFKLEYDPKFREFFLTNLNRILSDTDCYSIVSKIQRRFKEIKTYSANITMTLESAIDYVNNNKYENIHSGNDMMAAIAAVAKYSQEDFEKLQQIYDYGKQRIFSSIPRIEKNTEKYTYEVLRLDDPLALAIGTLTDCCQEIGNHAEACMAHSMIDKNGRVFVIRDKEGNICAQSWIWRNKDVLCFDNIEIPDKAFKRAKDLGISSIEFATEIYNIYKKAAHEILEVDKKAYDELFESGKITKEQYEGLKLRKITVGLGNNDIASVIKNNSEVDKESIATPLPFDSPVKLSRSLYTSDSAVQYVLEQNGVKNDYEGDTLALYNDTYIEYDDSNFDKIALLTINKLELVTKNDIETSLCSDTDEGNYVTKMAKNCYLNPATTKVILHPNFAIMYDEIDNKVRLGELFFNSVIENNSQQIDIENIVAMQIRLALDQISNGREVDISGLDERQQEMYQRAMNITEEEFDIERGVGHAR